MSKEDEYRRHAVTTVELARRARSGDKARLLVMADAWLNLADRAHKVARQQGETVRELHPSLRSGVFGPGSEAD